ncbi:MAG: radical SAM protein [Ginsengibacter sp.]
MMETNNLICDETLQRRRVSRIVQIHPTLNCNLACKHCYSSSAPGLKEGLDVALLLNILEQARDIGYNVVSMSGGEPFIYKSLEELMSQTKLMGYFNSVTSNGMLITNGKAKNILRYLDLIAISVDGKEEFHDALRGRKGAFNKMLLGLEVIKNSMQHYGFIHTVLPDSWKILSWLTEFSIGHKASLLHLHPIEISGRAKQSFGGLVFTPMDLHKIYIAHHYLSTFYEEEIFLQLDLLHKDSIVDNPNFVFHQSYTPEFSSDSFSSIFKELIIDEKGCIYPIAYGCSPFFKIGDIHSNEKLADMIESFMTEKIKYVIEMFNKTYFDIINDEEFEIFNWSERVIANSVEFENNHKEGRRFENRAAVLNQ